MMEFGTCPLCKMDIAPERKNLIPVICNHCGFTSAGDAKVHASMEKRNVTIFAGIALFIVAAHIQLSNWDSQSLAIIPIAVKQTLGMGSPADAEKKSEICMELKKWDCVEASYIETAKADPSLWQRSGDFQMKRAKYNDAAQSYYSFFQNGGNNLEASYSYAKALAELGQVDEAVKYFDEVLAARPDTLQVTVVTNYVKLLMAHQRYDQAKVLINKVRANSGPAGEMFMSEELVQIAQLSTASRE